MTTNGYYIPETNAETNGEIMGRCNALHDWLVSDVRNSITKGYTVSSDMKTIAAIMGFSDIIDVIERGAER